MEALAVRATVAMLLFASALLAPVPASAQVPLVEPEVRLEFILPEEPLDPILAGRDAEAPLVVPFRVTYTVPAFAYSPEPTVVEVQVTELPPWLAARADPDRFRVPMDASQARLAPDLFRSTTLTGHLALFAAPGAPALADGILHVKAVARENGAVGEASGERRGIVRVSYSARIDAVADPFAVSPDAGETVTVPIRVVNLGNGAVVVNATVEAAPHGVGARLNASETHLEHAGAPGRADATVFALEVSRAKGADAGEVVVRVASRHALGGSPVESRLVRVYVGDAPGAEGEGGAAGVGWVPALAFLAAAAIVAGVLVRR